MRPIAVFAAPFLFTMFAGALPAADQQMISLLMPNAKIVAGINVEQAKTSQFGQFVLRHMGSDLELQKFVEMSGFDPRSDLREILVATDLSGDMHSGLILARGNFHADRIAELATKTGGQILTSYKGVQLLGGPAGSKQVIGVIDNSLIVAGDLPSVQAAIDRKASSIDPALAARINELSTTQHAWTVSIAPVSAFSQMPMPDPTIQGALKGDLLKTVQQTSGGITFAGQQVQIMGEAVAKSKEDATSLGDVVKFLAGMIQVNAKGSPVTTLIQNLNVSTVGSTLKVNLSIEEGQLEAFLKSTPHPEPQKHKAAVL